MDLTHTHTHTHTPAQTHIKEQSKLSAFKYECLKKQGIKGEPSFGKKIVNVASVLTRLKVAE